MGESADGREDWSGWLSHPDSQVAAELVSGSADHEELATLLSKPGTLTLAGKLDLWQMLQPAVQPGSKLEFDYPEESVVVSFASPSSLTLSTDSSAVIDTSSGSTVELQATPKKDRWIPFTLKVATGGRDPSVAVSWRTSIDQRPRALALRRVLLPWAKPATVANEPQERQIPEIAGGDWGEGRKLFFGEKANCHKCHAVRGEGGKVGPDLSNLIHRDYASVLKDIRHPSAAINPDFLAYVVALDDGSTLSGIVNSSDPNTLTVADNTGKQVSIPRSAVESLSPSTVSVMPEKLLDTLSDREQKSLLAFLLMENR